MVGRNSLACIRPSTLVYRIFKESGAGDRVIIGPKSMYALKDVPRVRSRFFATWPAECASKDPICVRLVSTGGIPSGEKKPTCAHATSTTRMTPARKAPRQVVVRRKRFIYVALENGPFRLAVKNFTRAYSVLNDTLDRHTNDEPRGSLVNSIAFGSSGNA